MHFNPHTIAPIICLIMALCCGVYVLLHNHQARLNRIFFFVCLDLVAWMSYYIAISITMPEGMLLAWFKISYCFISFLPIMCFTFLSTYLNIPKGGFWYRVNSIIGFAICLLSLFTDEIVSGIVHLPWYPYPKAGNLHFLLILHCGSLAIFSLKIMLEGLRSENTSAKSINHLKYMFIGITVLTFGMLDFFGNYGIAIYNFGPFADILFLGIVTTAIIKHQLMDINIAIKKGLVYSFLISAITIIYLLVVLLFERLFSNYMRWQELTGSLLSAVVIAIAFIPLRNALQGAVDRLLFNNTAPEIAEENELLRQEIVTTEKFKAVATLASGVAHEIKNPLTALKTFSEYLPNKIDDKEFLRKFAPLLHKEVHRIDSLVHELLDFARPTPVQLRMTPLNALLDGILALLANDFKKHQIQLIKNDSDTANLELMLDPNLFKQAVLNILLNSIEAMTDGGRLTLTTYHDGTHASLRISDTGCGIHPKDLPHIFEPFYTKKSNGTGLGLSITQRIVEQHSGTIQVESTLGKGTDFMIRMGL